LGIRGFVGDSEELYGRPEHTTRLDSHPPARRHNLFACPRRDGVTSLVIGVEAKACEGFDGKVVDHARANELGSGRARCNLLEHALFNRAVFDEQTGEVLDEAASTVAIDAFTSMLAAAGSQSHESAFVSSGTTIRVITVETSFDG
jgi:hypothetical protein